LRAKVEISIDELEKEIIKQKLQRKELKEIMSISKTNMD
tara:strand:- start:1299 stop:1415 length:117 start_codon:yes stop_codon:yes gene_type:complete